MKFNLKNVFLSVGIFAFTLALVGVLSTNKAEAANCTADGGAANWSALATWDCGRVPIAIDNVIIPTTAVLTVDENAHVASVTIEDNAGAVTTLAIGSSYTLTVDGAVTITAPTGAATSTINVGGGTLVANSLAINAGAGGTNIALVTVGAGTLDIATNITFGGTASAARMTLAGSTVSVAGNFSSGGTLTGGTSTITFDGTGAQTMGTYETYYNVTVAGASNTVTASGTTGVTNNLTVTTGTLALGTSVFTVGALTSVATGGTLTMSTGTKIFSGDATFNSSVAALPTATITFSDALNINAGTFNTGTATFSVADATTIASGATLSITSATGSKSFEDLIINGTLTESAAEAVAITGSFENNGTFTDGTGTHTFSGTTKTISGSSTTTMSAVTIAGGGNYANSGTLVIATLTITTVTLTNTGTITVSSSLTGDGGFTNTTGTLNIGDAIDITTLTATNNANTVNYTASGDQIVKDPGVAVDYGNLGLSGSGAKSLASNTDISGNLTMGGTAKITLLTDSLSSANKLYFGTALQRYGTWGDAASSATHKLTNSYFTTGNTYLITITTGSSQSEGCTTNCGSGPGPDTTAPTNTSISINAGAASTSSATVTLSLSAVDDSTPIQMMISNDSTFTGGTWETYTTSKTWILTSGDGTKTVYVKFRDSLMNISTIVSDTIALATEINPVVGPTPGCSGGNLYNTNTGAACVNNQTLEIPGCGNRDTGFSTATGLSCVGNHVTTITPPNPNPTSFTSVLKFTKALNTKSLMADVKNLQQALNEVGGASLVVDGKWGKLTTAAVKKFQKDNGIAQVGVVGPITRAKLNTLLGL